MYKNLRSAEEEYSRIKCSTIIEPYAFTVECIIYKNYVYNILQNYYRWIILTRKKCTSITEW